MIRFDTAARWSSRNSTAAGAAAALLFGLHALAAPAHAQGAAGGNGGLSLRVDWLQAAAMPLHRQTLHSGSVAIQGQAQGWAYDIGYLRAARALSTVQGGFVVVSRPLAWGDAVFFPGLGVLAGYAQASRDTSGYDWVAASGTGSGHVPRYTRSSGVTIGGGASVAVEYPSHSTVGFRASVGQWMFSGSPLTGDRQRTMAGAGLTWRFGTATSAPSRMTTAARKDGGR